MRVALVQMDIAWEDLAANHARAASRVKEAASVGARLAILPEMFATGFSMDAARIAQPVGGPTEAFLTSLARELDIYLLAGVAELGDEHGVETGATLPRNDALLVSPGGKVRRASKLHPFSFAGEEKVVAPGERVVTWDVEGVRVTPLVCYDLRFPEPFRLAALDTDLFAVIANWPDRRAAHWRALLLARAIENLAYVAGVNRVGEGDGIRYLGDSALIGPWGETLVSASLEEALLVGEVDPAAVREARLRFPVLSDRRPASYRR